MMIAPYTDRRLLLVDQTEHSRVAGLLAAHWGNKEFDEFRPYASMVLAAQEHDNGWWDWEIKPTLNAEGRPIDYHGSGKHLGQVKLDIYRRGIQRVIDRDPYAGLFVLMHNVGLVSKGFGFLPGTFDYTTDPASQAFVREQEGPRTKLLDDLRRSGDYGETVSDEHLWLNYKVLEAVEQMAQFICNRYPFNSADRHGPSSTLGDLPVPKGRGREAVTLAIDVLDNTRAAVRPYPFDTNPLEVSYPARLLPERRYESREAFLREYYEAERIVVTRYLQKAEGRRRAVEPEHPASSSESQRSTRHAEQSEASVTPGLRTLRSAQGDTSAVPPETSAS